MNEESKIRKQWLIMFLVSMGFTTVIMIVNFLTGPMTQLEPKGPTLGLLAFSLISALGINYWIYHCAYKKSGTRLLTFLLYISPVSIATSIYISMTKPDLTQSYAYFWPLQIIGLVMGTYMLVLHWKLRKLNQKIQAAR